MVGTIACFHFTHVWSSRKQSSFKLEKHEMLILNIASRLPLRCDLHIKILWFSPHEVFISRPRPIKINHVITAICCNLFPFVETSHSVPNVLTMAIQGYCICLSGCETLLSVTLCTARQGKCQLTFQLHAYYLQGKKENQNILFT